MTTLTGVWPLIRLAIRRDRIRLCMWIVGFVAVVSASAASLPGLYPDQQAIDGYVRLNVGNPALIAFSGPGYGFDHPNIGTVLVNETQLWGAIGIALMSIFLITRHTRAEEDLERADLIRSHPIGRHAPNLAATIVIAATNVTVGVLCATAFVAIGYPTVGSIALAGSFVAVGLVFTGIALLAAQIASSGRAAIGMATSVLAIAFMLRALGDIGKNSMKWLSPIGWAQAVRAYGGEHWWMLGLCVAVSIALVGGALTLSTQRDLGAGLFHPRPGPASASRSLTRPLGLDWRLLRATMLGWVVTMFVTGIVFGSIAKDADTMIADNPQLADIFAQLHTGTISDSFFATTMMMLGLLTAGFSISAMLIPHSEERAGRIEPLLATPRSRVRWLTGHLLVTIAGSIGIVVAGGLGVGAAYALAVHDIGEIPRLIGASLVTVPAGLVLIGAATALYGLIPRATVAAWALLAGCAIVGFLGALLQLPGWARHLSPFEQLPSVPAEPLAIQPLVTLVAIAAALIAAGIWGLRRRDIPA